METIAGAVNGLPVTRGVNDDGVNPFTLKIANNGISTTKDVDTDGVAPIRATGGRVAIIGGTTSGRDHFPDPVVAVALTTYPPALEAYPFRMSAPDYCKLFYRVRRWKIHIQFSGNDGSPYTGVTDFTVENWSYSDIGDPSGTSLLATIEADWGCYLADGIVLNFDDDRSGGYFPIAPNGTYDAGSYVTDYTSSGTGKDGFSVSHELNFLFRSPNYDADVAELTCELSYSAEIASVDVESRPSLFVSATAIGAIAVDGVDLATIYKSSDEATLTAWNMTIDTSEFWAFAARDGSPIYDTATGAELQDPLS